MTRSEYIKDIENRISKLSPQEIEEALAFYNEILDDRGIADDDEVPSDMPSSRTVGFEILRDVNIEYLKSEDEVKKEGRKASTFGTIALWILALPLAFPLAMGLLGLTFGLLMAMLGIAFGFTVGGVVSIGSSLVELFSFQSDPARAIYLVGVILISLAVIILTLLAVRGIFGWIREKLINYKNRRTY